MLGLPENTPKSKNLDPSQFMVNQITDSDGILYHDRPDDWDEADWHVVAGGILMGFSRFRILNELKVLWKGTGADYKFDHDHHALEFLVQAIRHFKPHRNNLKRLYRDAESEISHYAQQNARLAMIDKYIRILDESMTEKIMGGVDLADMDSEMQHLERLLKLAKTEMGKTSLNRHLHTVTPPMAGPEAPETDENLISDITAEEIEKRMLDDASGRLASNG